MACGTGKTLTALFIAQRLIATRTLVLVPSLSLLSDTLREWTANAPDFDFLPVCSDDTVTEPDAAVSTTSDLGFPVTTDPIEIAAFLRRPSASQVVFATYQSSPRIAEAFRMGQIPRFDLVIADEAHRCAGRVSSDFAVVLDTDAIYAERRLFMTATPRFFTGRVVQAAKEADFEVASMDDMARFGPAFHRLGFAEAIRRELLTDYQVVVVGVDDATYLDWAEHGRFVTTDGTTVTDARTLAGQIGLAKAMRRYELRRTISFHSRVSRAREFAGSMPRVVDWMPASERPSGQLWSHYASGEMSAGTRAVLLDRLRFLDDQELGLLANARCLGEGIDVPALDGVAFIDPRRSEVDIVQAVGRAIRLAEDKKVGTIVIPVFIGDGDDPATTLDDSAFKPVWDVIKALRAHDDELGEQLDELRRELGRGTKHVRIPAKIRLDLPARIGTDFVVAFDVHLVDETTESWEFWFGLLQRFIEREGHANMKSDHLEDGHRLGPWVHGQRRNLVRGLLAPDRVARLEALPGWTWDARGEWWEEGFDYLQRFIQREGHAQVPKDHYEDAFGLRQWVQSQRTAYLYEELAPARIARLEALPDWTWSALGDKWGEGFGHLQRFAEREGHTRVPHDHVEKGYRLGQWVSVQRVRLPHARSPGAADRMARLDALPGWTWSTLADKWERGFEHLQRFAEREGHTRVPWGFVEDDFRLGAWAQRQRTLKATGRLDTSRIARLEALPGWTWSTLGDRSEARPTRIRNTNNDQWEKGFRHLSRFAEREGHARVPTGWLEDGYRLGSWVSAQRHSERPAADRAARLESLPGWSWDPHAEQWEVSFRQLQRFVEREGHALVRLDHVEDGRRLGAWVTGQRAAFIKGRLDAERIARLEEIPGWTWDVLAEKWEEGFTHLCRFADREGHARVPKSRVEEGYQLGTWVNAQRSRYATGKLAPSRVARLEAVPGWVWSALKKSDPRPRI